MGFWDVVEDIAEGAADVAGDIVDTAGDIIDEAGEALGDAAEAIGDAFEEAGEAIGEAIEDIGEAVADAVEEAIDAVGEAIEDAAEAIAETAEDIWDHVTDIAEDAWEAAAGAAEDTWEAVAGAAEDAWEAIAQAAEDTWEEIANAAEEVWEATEDAAEAAWEAGGAAIEAIGDGIAEAYEWSVDAAEAAAEWLWGRIVDLGELLLQLGACLGGQVVYQLAKSGNVLANFFNPPKLLPAAFRADMEALFNTGFGTVFFVDDASLTANWFAEGTPTDGMTFAHAVFAGITVNNIIFIASPWDQTVPDDRTLMAHELFHVMQYRRLITEPAFACAYGIGYAEAGFDYRKNPFEDSAYKFVTDNEASIL